jgi:DNA-binding MarR family transcriptional regulator
MRSWPDIESVWTNPGAQGENLRISEFPTFHLLRLSSLAKTCVSREYLEPFALSVPEWRMLSTVVALSPVPFADITSMTTMDKGQVSRTLRSAQAKGLVATEVVPVEKRPGEFGGPPVSRVVVTITEAGRRLYEKVMPIAQRYQLGLLELMDPEERRILLGVLQRLYRHLNEGAGRNPEGSQD